MKKILAFIGLIAVGSSFLNLAANEVTSKNNAKMKLFFANYPASDANGDRELTVAEMKAFILKNVKSSSTSENSPELKKFLRHAPKSDLNGDKVLRKSELISYLGRI